MTSAEVLDERTQAIDFDGVEEARRRPQVAESRIGTANGAEAPPTVVVIPAYNEERFIGTVVLKALHHADVVVVVDDGSSDATAEVAMAAGAIVVKHARNQGKGVALNTGFRRARELHPAVVITLDADGQHLPDEMARLARPILENEADIVVGSRYLTDDSDVPQHRVWGHRVFNALTYSVSGVPVTDSQSGFRAFSPRALARLTFNSNGFAVESEMQLLAREHQLRLCEVPITIHYHDKPKRPVVAHGLTVLSGLLRLTGQYRPLLFFGLPGLILLAIGFASGIWLVQHGRAGEPVPVSYSLLTGILTTLAALSLFTGIILHSVRGLLLTLLHGDDDQVFHQE